MSWKLEYRTTTDHPDTSNNYIFSEISVCEFAIDEFGRVLNTDINTSINTIKKGL